MGYKMLNKAKVTEIVGKCKTSLLIETYGGSKPTRYLKMLTTTNGERELITIGRVPKSIYSWFEIIDMESQPGYINVSWEKFGLTTAKQNQGR